MTFWNLEYRLRLGATTFCRVLPKKKSVIINRLLNILPNLVKHILPKLVDQVTEFLWMSSFSIFHRLFATNNEEIEDCYLAFNRPSLGCKCLCLDLKCCPVAC